MRRASRKVRDIKAPLKDIAASHGYTLTDFHEGISFVLNCRLYLTDIEGVYVTDYDWINKDSLEEGLFAFFSRKTKQHILLDAEALEDKARLTEILKTL